MTAIEEEIQKKGLTAPRITLVDVEANIRNVFFFTAQQGVDQATTENGEYLTGTAEDWQALGLLTFCVIVLRNGFTVTGESACASPENFDFDLGKKIARQNAINKIWPLMGYELRTSLMPPALTLEDSIADLEGRPRGVPVP